MNAKSEQVSGNVFTRLWKKRQARIAALSHGVVHGDGPYFVGRGPLLVLLFAALIGTFAAGFLTYRHIVLAGYGGAVGESVLCRADGRINCDAILQSGYSDILGFIPSAALGLTGFVFALWCIVNGLLNERVRKFAWAILLLYFCAAIAFSGYYVYLLAFVVDYICTWCLVVHAANLFSLAVLVFVAARNGEKFLLPEISTRAERTYFLIGGVMLSLFVFAASGYWEKSLSFYDAKTKYEELANDPLVIRTVLRSSPDYTIAVTGADPVYGSPAAPHAIILFSDFQCPICARTERFLRTLVDLNPGVLKLIYKNYPLSKECNPSVVGNLHPMGCKAARAAQAAFILGGEKAFWKYADGLFQLQKQLSKEPWLSIARNVGLEPERFQELMVADSAAGKKVTEDIAEGMRLRLTATPQIFFAGKRIPENFKGDYLVDALEDLIRGSDPTKREFQLKRR